MSRGSIIATNTTCLWCDKPLFHWIGGGLYKRIHYPNECPDRPNGSPDTKEMRMGVFFDKDNKQIKPEDYLKPKEKTNTSPLNNLRIFISNLFKR